MSGTNSFENEVQALASIYEDDLHVQGNTLTIRVHSLQNDPGNEEIDAQIDLELCCPDNYPKELPEIAFKNCRGLSHKQVNTLTAQVEAYGITLKGNPMIFDLVCYVLDYLIDNNRPRKKSCYDEMMCRKEQELARFKLDEVRKMKKVCDVKRKVQEKLEENYSSDEDDFESKTQVISNDNFRDDYMKNTIIMCNPALCHCSKYIRFSNKVLRGQCIDHNECCISYCALDTTTGEQLIIHEWILKPGQQANNIQNILKSIENEFNYLKKLNHENLNSYVDFKCMKNDEKDEYVVYIAEKFVSMVTLNTFIKQSFIFDLEFVQFLVQSVLKAILYLHERKVVLKNLSENNIYFNKLGNFKIASYSTPKRMGDVYRLCQNEETEYTKSDQKTDIKHLGLILNDVMELTSKKNDNKGSNHKLVEFKDFIDKCLIKNEERRWGARELLDHDFLKSNSSYEATGTRRQSYSELTFETIDDADQDKIDLSVMEMNSRFPKDFTVLDTVGKGSFGTVWKVRNKLDRQIYAIKKIKLDKNSTDFDRKIIREVKLLSKLKHENVVRYYGSWIEVYSETENLMENNVS
ncbi:UNVERIFIED_CONTAM: hypothetical protein PYX00_007559 [Menopon gallinae]|uniref:non-specific serine/threonine protein kinase n=1 Tax=Menopon gallinae TaxID=328185 RepID=A0AAW2HJU3_9NEOP